MSGRAWVAEAACQGYDPEMFFPVEVDLVPPEIRRLCGFCPVREECLDWALRHELDGVWAGTSPVDRRRMRKEESLRVKSPGSYHTRGANRATG